MTSPGFVEDYDSDASIDAQYFESYADLSVHHLMLSDAPRMSFFHDAICTSGAASGRVVVDLGSGTGVLAMWAARGGASHVFSIEASALRHLQRRALLDNAVADRVTLIGEDFARVAARGVADFVSRHRAALRGGVGLLVSEWMGFALLHEGMLSTALRARDFFAQVNAAMGVDASPEMLPETARLFAAPICLSAYGEAQCRFWRDVRGLDLSAFGRADVAARVGAGPLLVDLLSPNALLHEGVELAAIRLHTASVEETVALQCHAHFAFGASDVFRAHLQGHNGRAVMDGLAIWFSVSFRGQTLNTSPHSAPTHWKQTTVLLPEAAREEELVAFTDPNDVLDVSVQFVSRDPAGRCYTIELELL